MRIRIAVLLVLGLLLTGTLVAKEAISFQLLRGRAALSRNGGTNWLDLGPEPVEVTIQDMLRTEGETRGELKFPDGSLFRLKSNTTLTLVSGGVKLKVGETWFNLRKQGRRFQVVTPTTVCGVLGTTFDVNVDRFGHTKVRVFRGIVSVRAQMDQRRRQLVLQRGMMTSVRDKSATADKPERFNPQKVERTMQKEWDRRRLPPMKIGPGRSSLPPMPDQKRISPFEREQMEREKKKVSPIRQRFQRIQDLRRHNAKKRVFSKPFQQKRALEEAKMREDGHSRTFGTSRMGPLGAQDYQRKKQELLRVTNEVNRKAEDARRTEAELQAIGAKLASTTDDSERKALTRQGDMLKRKLQDLRHELQRGKDQLRKLQNMLR